MKYCLLGWMLFLIYAPIKAGTTTVFPDSLKQKIANLSDRDRVAALATYSYDIYQKNTGLANAVLDSALKIAQKGKHILGEAKVLKVQGIISYYGGKYEISREQMLNSLSLFEKAGDANGKGEVCNELGNMLRKHGDIRQGEIYLRKAMEIYQSNKNIDGLANTNNNLGILFETTGNLDSAMIHYQRALELYASISNSNGMSYSLDYIGLIHAYRNEFIESETYLLKALAIREKLGAQFAISTSLVNLGEVNLAMNRYDKAKDYFRKSLHLADSLSFPDLQSYNYKMLAEVTSRKGDYRSAFDFYKKHTQLNDSLFNLNRNKQLAEMQAKYETAEKEKQNAELLRDNQVKELNLTQKNNQLLMLSAVLVLGALGGLLFMNRQKLRRQQQLHDEIQHQQALRLRAIIDSQEAERKRIAAELHDGLGQSLAAVRMRLSTEPASKETVEMLDRSCVELREISHNMMPSNLLRAGLVTALKELAERISRTGKMQVNVDAEEDLPKQGASIEIQLFRIVQELLTNIVKYAEATSTTIQLMSDGKRYTIMVEDNGKGFDKSQLQKSAGNGWYNIQSRLSMLNGQAEIDTAPGRGTVITVDIPVKSN